MKKLDATLYFILLVASLFTLLGGWLVVTTCRDIALGIVAEDWPQTPGRVLEFTEDSDNTAEGGNTWVAHVRYGYTVGGQAYEGTTIHPTYGSPPSSTVDHRLISLLKSAREVRVFHDRAEPGRSTLSTGFHSGSLAVFFAGFTFFAAGLAMTSFLLGTFTSFARMTMGWVAIGSVLAVMICFVLAIVFLVAGGRDFASGITVVR